ncbi:hypothetical protein SH528x_003384 [Novipirellula sp. SH528]|uniref:hypothetical protein n=1 Tax=Novipirellula sp. SH528 TaxID=3454466 RepID=UPI003FA10D82
MAGWFFQKHDGYQDIDQTSAGEAFSGGAIRDLATALVREGIQNALDARALTSELDPVVVKISLGKCPAPVTAHNRKWFNILFDHVALPDVGAPNAPRPNHRNEYLLFEDFNTKGLVGDYSAPYKPGEENNFVNFLYHDGVTGKGERKLGSRGVGKIVFTMASRIRSTFAFTIRAGDENLQPLLIGKNLLRFRQLNGNLYGGRAYFLKEWRDGESRQPIDDDGMLADFRTSFPLKRRNEPGLSLVIPFLDPSVDAISLRFAIVAEYHYAILRGELQVELDDHGAVESFSADRLPRVGDEQVDAEVALARWAVSLPSIELQTVRPLSNGIQKLDETLVSEEIRNAITSALNHRDRVAVRVPLYIHPKDAAPLATHFDVFLERAERLSAKPTFIRELLPVSDVRDAKSASKVRGLVVIAPGPLADFLRSAEGANHTDWSPRTDRFQERYKGRLGEIRFVATAVSRLVEIAFGNANEPVGGIATQFFSSAIPNATSTALGKAKKTSGVGPEIPPDDLEPKPPALFRVEQTNDGFTIRQNDHGPASEGELPERLRVRVAYDVINGSPWSRFDEIDFDLRKPRGNVRLSASNSEIVRSDKGNRFAVESIDPGFEVTAIGFDPNRDLIVDVTTTTAVESKSSEGEDDR